MKDKTIVCKDCGSEFVLTVEDQEWYAEKGFTEPKRCLDCRKARRANGSREENNDYGKKKNSRY